MYCKVAGNLLKLRRTMIENWGHSRKEYHFILFVDEIAGPGKFAAGGFITSRIAHCGGAGMFQQTSETIVWCCPSSSADPF